jgi:hypothetical protein
MPVPSPRKCSVRGGGKSDTSLLDRCDALEIQKLVSLAMKKPGGTSDISAVVGPVQQGLPLARPAKGIAGLAVLSDLRDVPSKRPPALDLAPVLLGHPPPHEVAAIPLEPAARIVVVKPTVLTPDR